MDPVLKTGEQQCSVGSNPTPSAMHQQHGVAEIEQTQIDGRWKGVPAGASLRVADVGAQGWNVARGDLPLPVTTLRRGALEHNIATMAEYCAREGVLFAPHGKTTMSPQLFHRQLDAGAWGITAATPTQVVTMRMSGVRRVLMANQLTEPSFIRWIAGELADDPGFEFLCLVDSAAGVELLESTLGAMDSSVVLPVLLEAGVQQGRSGARTVEEALRVARLVAEAPHLELAGVETYEGLVTTGGAPADLEAVDAHFAAVRGIVRRLAAERLLTTAAPLVTAGGSTYFDRVVAALRDWDEVGLPIRLVLRSGCYVSHDLAEYHALSPLDGRRPAGEPLRLQNALEAWGTVLSRPEPDLAIVGAGKRDVPYDVSLPTVVRVHRRDGTRGGLPGAEVFRVMDQHAFIRLAPEQHLAPGDVVVFGLSHPCTAFDKLRLVPIIDDDATVVEAVLTYF